MVKLIKFDLCNVSINYYFHLHTRNLSEQPTMSETFPATETTAFAATPSAAAVHGTETSPKLPKKPMDLKTFFKMACMFRMWKQECPILWLASTFWVWYSTEHAVSKDDCDACNERVRLFLVEYSNIEPYEDYTLMPKDEYQVFVRSFTEYLKTRFREDLRTNVQPLRP